MKQIPRIVIVGGGVAGLEVATYFGNKMGKQGKAQVTLIDRSSLHVWKPMLHTFAAGTANAHQQGIPFFAQAKRNHFNFMPGELSTLDRARRFIEIKPPTLSAEPLEPRRFDYDILVLAMGSRANDFGIQGVSGNCFFIDDLCQAETFNQRLRGEVLHAAMSGGTIDIAIVGGGATGVELAAEISQLVEIGSTYGAAAQPARLRLTLIETSPRILGGFPEAVSTLASAKLHELGVDIRTDTTVIGVDADGFMLKGGERVNAMLKVWAAGVRAPAVLDGIDGLQRARTGQLVTRPTLQLIDDDRVFALGDCASLTLPGNDRPLAPTAQVAHQQASHLCQNLPRFLRGQPIKSFEFHDLGALVSLGGYGAYGTMARRGMLPATLIRGWVAQIGHAMLYRQHQFGLNGLRRGSLIWLSDILNRVVQPRIRLD
ncbi:NAD(P)/FAD-dependent oxidoreductase [Pseudomonas helleri]|uniref:NAD(P)/FAD-dependent oxidoreductase n=1 Tax=Pseudomonas helleri TaxID=1608996 RepID=A0A7X1W6J3_9PSED|nr:MULTISPECIES: NAD(P)/FAD-dependent oxidoreductase [Pseudomonas]MQT46179.1 NAD(P)/FAD-dependent oxidoreductase [Pseudomonas helleri]MQT57316.1 NAD(P)/FAD-dependent oxidoreductase [Pseudomonas sp. FSL R10-0399]MQT88264.1 NAD(P)/FAD-dependent oxidoreductase [Pseudomonas helleri]